MNDSILNSNSDPDQNSTVTRSPLIAGICAAICVFCSILAFFFGDWIPFGDKEFSCWTAYLIADYRTFVDDAIFLNFFILSIACFAGYLFTGALNKRVGIISLLIAGFFGGLYMITLLPSIIRVGFLPDFFYWGLFGNVSIKDIPYFIWFFLTFMIIPVVYLIGSLRAKTIPVWKSFVLLIAPVFVFLFLFYSFIIVGIDATSYSFTLSRGMAFWLPFAVVIFSELIRTKVKKFYVWLTLILSAVAAVSGIIFISALSFGIYQKTMEYKKAAESNKGYNPCGYYRSF